MPADNITTHDQVGKVEDVSDIIKNIAPTRTPVYSMLMADDCHNPLYEELEDDLAEANPDNAAIEGADAEDADQGQPEPVQGRTQIFTKTVKVSGSARATDTYGRADELTYQVEKKGKEIKRDIEAALMGRKQAPVAGSESAARKTGSVAHYVHADTTIDGSSTLDEAKFNAMMEKVYEEGGEPGYLVTAPGHATTIAGWAMASGRQRDFQQSTTLVNVIDFLVTPHGSVEVVQDIFASPNYLVALDTEYARLKELRPMQLEELAKTGDADKYQLICELGYHPGNRKAHGLLDNAYTAP